MDCATPDGTPQEEEGIRDAEQGNRTSCFKKSGTKPWKKRSWCIAKLTPEFRAGMYDVLDLYEEPFDPRRPTVGFDEKPKQLLEDGRRSIPMRPGHAMKFDGEYIRRGTANIFMAVEHKAGKRTTRVTARRTKRDFAKFIKHIVDKVYPDADQIRLVLDNLNTHNGSSIIETYGPEEARRILGRVEFHYTPVHASWLNVAEIEIGIMDTECTRKRIPGIGQLRKEVSARTARRNKNRMMIDWVFTRERADVKLSKYYVT
jgi:hypothetical protein